MFEGLFDAIGSLFGGDGGFTFPDDPFTTFHTEDTSGDDTIFVPVGDNP